MNKLVVLRHRLDCTASVAQLVAEAYNLKHRARLVKDSRGGYYMFSAWSKAEHADIYEDAVALCGNGRTPDGYFYSNKDSEDFVLAFEMLVEKFQLEKYVELK